MPLWEVKEDPRNYDVLFETKIRGTLPDSDTWCLAWCPSQSAPWSHPCSVRWWHKLCQHVESIRGRKERKDKGLEMQRNSSYIYYLENIPRQSWVHPSLSPQPLPPGVVTAGSLSTSSHWSKGRGWSGYSNMPSHASRRIYSTCNTPCTPWAVALVWMAWITCTDTLAVWQSG